ncbi:MAG: 50S ribosomal protein L4 [Candidatus Omnitrophota bacterium]
MTTKPKKTKEKKIDVPVVDVYSLAGKKTDKFKLDPDVFNASLNTALLHQVVTMYRANSRQGNASTKTRANVRGGGKKPWKQKGTGRARAGSIRSPLWRGGGIVFGPHTRDYSYSLPKALLKRALITGLSAKTRDNEIMLLEKDPELKAPKTKEISKILGALKIGSKKTMFVYSKKDVNLILSCKNIKNLALKTSSDFNAYDVLSSSKVLFSKDTHDAIVKRLSEDKTYGTKRRKS